MRLKTKTKTIKPFYKQPKLLEPSREPSTPPEKPVVWVIYELKNPLNAKTAFAQTAFKAHELSGINVAFVECGAMIHQGLTEKRLKMNGSPPKKARKNKR